MTLAAISQARRDASIQNGRKSKGPASPAGRARSAQNALKHGLTAKTVVLPGEDPERLQARVDAWKADLRPTDEAQDYLVARAVHISWQLDRADRTIAARLTESILAAPTDRDAREAEEAADLGRRLLFDPCGHPALYPHSNADGALRISWSGDPDDPLEPALLVARLEATAAGCRWLLDRWAELRALLEDGLSWQAPDRFRATRLLGLQPLMALDDRRLTAIHLACRAMEPEGPPAFADLKTEMYWYSEKQFAARIEGRGGEARRPADPAAGRAALMAIVGEATRRLEVLLGCHRERAAAELAGGSDALAFDDSPEGELLRRYQLGLVRAFYRSVDTFYKARREAERQTAEDDESPEPPAEEAPEPSPGAIDETNPTAPSDPAPSLSAIDETNPTAADDPAPSLAAIDKTNPIAADDPAPSPAGLGETNPTAPSDPAPPLAGFDETNPTAPEAPAPSPATHAETNPTTPAIAAALMVGETHGEQAPAVAPHPEALAPLPMPWPGHIDEVYRALQARLAADPGPSPDPARPAPRAIDETKPNPDAAPAPPPAAARPGRPAPDPSGGPRRPFPEPHRRMLEELERIESLAPALAR